MSVSQNKAKYFDVIRQNHVLLLLKQLLKSISFSILLSHLSHGLRASSVIQPALLQ